MKYSVFAILILFAHQIMAGNPQTEIETAFSQAMAGTIIDPLQEVGADPKSPIQSKGRTSFSLLGGLLSLLRNHLLHDFRSRRLSSLCCPGRY